VILPEDANLKTNQKLKGKMIPKYHIEYAIELGGHREPHVRDFQTDDPVACEEFLVAALASGIKIKAIRHEGLDVSQREFDKLVKSAATTLAAKHVARSLGLNAEQVHYRFGLAA
jgi:hypothetical protein